MTKKVVVLGSTGSVGTAALEVIEALPEQLSAYGMSAHRRWQQLIEQATALHPRWITVTDMETAQQASSDCDEGDWEFLMGSQGAESMVMDADTDVVVAAIVGAAGLKSTWAALKAGKTVALANKETMVMAGPLIDGVKRETGAELLPVDSEHSAVFQALQAGSAKEVRRILLTASGGPFLRFSPKHLHAVTPEQALCHPTWNMGPKISVDSATMMNKALEVIEARWLFNLNPDQIEVVIHPESMVHSMVEFCDGSVMIQAALPDMRLPIQYALTFPERHPCPSPIMDWEQAQEWHFEPSDPEQFPSLDLGFEVANRGGTAGAVLNAANEVAVEKFLNIELAFLDIPRVCRSVLDQHAWESNPTLDQVVNVDNWAREEVARWCKVSS